MQATRINRPPVLERRVSVNRGRGRRVITRTDASAGKLQMSRGVQLHGSTCVRLDRARYPSILPSLRKAAGARIFRRDPPGRVVYASEIFRRRSMKLRHYLYRPLWPSGNIEGTIFPARSVSFRCAVAGNWVESVGVLQPRSRCSLIPIGFTLIQNRKTGIYVARAKCAAVPSSRLPIMKHWTKAFLPPNHPYYFNSVSPAYSHALLHPQHPCVTSLLHRPPLSPLHPLCSK